MNSLTGEMLGAIDTRVRRSDRERRRRLGRNPDRRTGEKAFSSGMDLKEAIPALTSGDQLGYTDPTKRQFSDVYKPIICAVNGFCIAGGMEMLEGTDLRIATDHATFGLARGALGHHPHGRHAHQAAAPDPVGGRDGAAAHRQAARRRARVQHRPDQRGRSGGPADAGGDRSWRKKSARTDRSPCAPPRRSRCERWRLEEGLRAGAHNGRARHAL